ncbi:hypothetical protein CKAH01_05855 [Colletotrichum kahawae]|uniref:Uncharacterized protein n=1 Tax=Colletotrichum kahawae TaxID=34407 RepID=A0AAD9YDB5_COLKA|nr:hypothetical protein CKAH01_05855 [Colletotrichum kahawae]
MRSTSALRRLRLVIILEAISMRINIHLSLQHQQHNCDEYPT